MQPNASEKPSVSFSLTRPFLHTEIFLRHYQMCAFWFFAETIILASAPRSLDTQAIEGNGR